MRWDTSQPAAGFSDAAPWEPLGDDPPGTDIATEAADPGSLLSTYRSLVGLRAAHPALATGDWIPVDAATPSVVAYVRHLPGQSLLVVANVADEPIVDPELNLEAGPLCGNPTARMVHGAGEVAAPIIGSTGGFDAYIPVPRLGPREGVVIELAQ